MTEYYDEYYDESYDEAFAEDWEEARRAPRRRVSTARARTMVPRPASQPVTQTQFQVAINQVNSSINRNSTAIQQVNARLSSVDGQARRQSGMVRTNAREIGKVKEFLLIFPFLQQAIGQNNQQLAAILPFLVLGGYGESGDSGGSGGGLFGGGTSGLLLVLALAGGLNQNPANQGIAPVAG